MVSYRACFAVTLILFCLNIVHSITISSFPVLTGLVRFIEASHDWSVCQAGEPHSLAPQVSMNILPRHCAAATPRSLCYVCVGVCALCICVKERETVHVCVCVCVCVRGGGALFCIFEVSP